MNEPIEIPISVRYYRAATIAPILGLSLLVWAYFVTPPQDGKTLFFVSFGCFCVLFSGLHLPYLLNPKRYSMQISEIGVFERTSLSTRLIEWKAVKSVNFYTINDSTRMTTYLLHSKTSGRWFSFGKIDCHNLNHYALDNREVFEMIHAQFVAAQKADTANIG